MLKASTVLAAGAVFAEPLAAAAPEPTPLSAAMIQAARKEGTLAFYTAMELPLAEGLSKAFEAKYPEIKVRVKRSGAERVFQRIGKEEEIRIHEVDVVCSTDAGHFVRWRREGLLAPFLPEDAARHLPPEQIGADGMYATAFASLSPIGYNTNLVKPEEAPATFADLLHPRWQGKIVKGNPDYSGTVFTATFALSRDLGWSYFERIAQQRSCRCSHRSIRRTGSPAARVPCKPTVSNPSSCCCENVVRRWKSSMPARARRSSSLRVPSLKPRPVPTRHGCSRASCSASRRNRVSWMPTACARSIGS